MRSWTRKRTSARTAGTRFIPRPRTECRKTQMMNGSDPQTARDKRNEAVAVCKELNQALKSRGVVLPSLWVEPVGDALFDLRPLIDLGHCNLNTARALLAVVQNAREHTEAGA